MADGNLQDDSGSGYESQFKALAKSLWDKVEAGSYAEAAGVIQELNDAREQSLYQEIGLLTRSLHEAIKNIQIEYEVGAGSEIADTSDRLGYVIEMTSKAANKTMDRVEEGMPLAQGIQQESKDLGKRWRQFMNKELKPAEFRELSYQLNDYFSKTEKSSDKIYQQLSDILMAQDYQDLTGQVIQRVTTMIKDVEERLVNLVAMAGQIDTITGTASDVHEDNNKQDQLAGIAAEGPVVNAEQREDVVSSQDDVDDLLSSLGF